MKKNPTKHPVDLPPLTLGHLKNFQVSIFEFPEATRGWKPEVKVLDPYGSRTSNFQFPSSRSLWKLKNLTWKFFRASRKAVADQQNTMPIYLPTLIFLLLEITANETAFAKQFTSAFFGLLELSHEVLYEPMP